MGVRSGSRTYTEIFYECLPYYLSIGMTAEEFWEGDLALPIFYREAEKIRQEREFKKADHDAWLNGRYVYEAFCCAAPLLRAFAKKGTIALPYPDKPYGMKDTKENMSDIDEEEKKQQAIENERLKMQLYLERFISVNKDKGKNKN